MLASDGFQTMFRRVYDWYQEMGHAMKKKYPELRSFHPESPFPAMTLNMGPRVSCKPHVDHANPAYGVCAITALGVFNDDLGGHLVLDDLRLVIQFPANSTILIPSASVVHHNIPFRPGEERYSLVQYGAAGLFRWWEHDFRTAVDYQRQNKISKSYEELRAEHRLWEGTERFTNWQELLQAEQYDEYPELLFDDTVQDIQDDLPDLDRDDEDRMEGPSKWPYDPRCYRKG